MLYILIYCPSLILFNSNRKGRKAIKQKPSLVKRFRFKTKVCKGLDDKHDSIKVDL